MDFSSCLQSSPRVASPKSRFEIQLELIMGEEEAKTSGLRMERLTRSLIYANLVERTSVPATRRVSINCINDCHRQ